MSCHIINAYASIRRLLLEHDVGRPTIPVGAEPLQVDPFRTAFATRWMRSGLYLPDLRGQLPVPGPQFLEIPIGQFPFPYPPCPVDHHIACPVRAA